MHSINIVLIEPQIPQNTGNISRTCAVTGAILHLVEPMGFKITEKSVKRAGLDYWDKLDIRYYKDTADFFKKNINGEFYYYTTKSENIYSDIDYPDNVYLIFGREDKGISEELLVGNKDRCVRVPMMGDTRSLNLSNTVAIACYEVLRQKGFANMNKKGILHKLEWK